MSIGAGWLGHSAIILPDSHTPGGSVGWSRAARYRGRRDSDFSVIAGRCAASCGATTRMQAGDRPRCWRRADRVQRPRSARTSDSSATERLLRSVVRIRDNAPRSGRARRCAAASSAPRPLLPRPEHYCRDRSRHPRVGGVRVRLVRPRRVGAVQMPTSTSASITGKVLDVLVQHPLQRGCHEILRADRYSRFVAR